MCLGQGQINIRDGISEKVLFYIPGLGLLCFVLKTNQIDSLKKGGGVRKFILSAVSVSLYELP